jgi:large subunit ribosomal protein L3
MRTGLIAEKVGMSSIFSETGDVIPVTLLEVRGCEVVAVKNEERDGYTAVQLGYKGAKVKNTTKPLRGHYAKAKVTPKKKLIEFRVSRDAILVPGSKISVAHFVPGQFVDVKNLSKGKGFAGVMKRWNFAGLRASHGVSISHRSHGSTGQCQDPGRVPKGKKMAGQMGAKVITQQNLEVVLIDERNSLVLVKGSIPGHNGSFVKISDAVKKSLPANAPFPAGLLEESNKKEQAVEAVEQNNNNAGGSSDESKSN